MNILDFTQTTNAFRFIVNFSGNIEQEMEWLCDLASATISRNFGVDIEYKINYLKELLPEKVSASPSKYEFSLLINYDFDDGEMTYQGGARDIGKGKK